MSTENYASGGIVHGPDGDCDVWLPLSDGEQLITLEGEVFQWEAASAKWLPTGEQIDMAAILARFRDDNR